MVTSTTTVTTFTTVAAVTTVAAAVTIAAVGVVAFCCVHTRRGDDNDKEAFAEDNSATTPLECVNPELRDDPRCDMIVPRVATGPLCVGDRCLDGSKVEVLKGLDAQMRETHGELRTKQSELRTALVDRLDELSDAQAEAFEQLNVTMSDRQSKLQTERTQGFQGLQERLDTTYDGLQQGIMDDIQDTQENLRARQRAQAEARQEAILQVKQEFMNRTSASAAERKRRLTELTEEITEAKLIEQHGPMLTIGNEHSPLDTTEPVREGEDYARVDEDHPELNFSGAGRFNSYPRFNEAPFQFMVFLKRGTKPFLYKFYAPEENSYDIQLFVYALQGNTDSFFMELDGGGRTWWDLHAYRETRFGYMTWRKGTLSKGVHTLGVHGREPTGFAAIRVLESGND